MFGVLIPKTVACNTNFGTYDKKIKQQKAVKAP